MWKLAGVTGMRAARAECNAPQPHSGEYFMVHLSDDMQSMQPRFRFSHLPDYVAAHKEVGPFRHPLPKLQSPARKSRVFFCDAAAFAMVGRRCDDLAARCYVF